ncbi:MAG: RNA methyltransferase substrate-binding domain-containing protein, partial [Gammaproteobacteria bacterium]
MSDIVCGVHAVRLALEQGQVKRLLLDQRRKDRRLDELRNLAVRRNVGVNEVTAAELKRLAAGVRHQGALAEIEGAAPLTENQLETWLTTARDPLVLVLDG